MAGCGKRTRPIADGDICRSTPEGLQNDQDWEADSCSEGGTLTPAKPWRSRSLTKKAKRPTGSIVERLFFLSRRTPPCTILPQNDRSNYFLSGRSRAAPSTIWLDGQTRRAATPRRRKPWRLARSRIKCARSWRGFASIPARTPLGKYHKHPTWTSTTSLGV